MAVEPYLRRVFMGTLSLVILAAAALLLAGLRSWARGVVLGGSASLVNLLIMAAQARWQMSLLAGQSQMSGYGRYALRMAVLAAALMYAAINPNVELWGPIPSLFAAQVVMFAGEFLEGRTD